MNEIKRISIKLISYSEANPGIKDPGFCVVFGNDSGGRPHFFCGFGTVEEADDKRGDFAVVCGYIQGSVGKTVSAYENAVVRMNRQNPDYAMAGYYAYYFNLIRVSEIRPGEYVIIRPTEKDADLIRKIADINGLRQVSAETEADRTGLFRKKLLYENCSDIGIGFGDEAYQKGTAYYPDAYIDGMMKINIRNACDMLDRDKCMENYEMVKTEKTLSGVVREAALFELSDDDKTASSPFRLISKYFHHKICPGVLEIIYRGKRWEETGRLLSLVGIFDSIKNNEYMITEGNRQLAVTGALADGSVFSILSIYHDEEITELTMHFDGNTFRYNGKNFVRYENGKEGIEMIALAEREHI